MRLAAFSFRISFSPLERVVIKAIAKAIPRESIPVAAETVARMSLASIEAKGDGLFGEAMGSWSGGNRGSMAHTSILSLRRGLSAVAKHALLCLGDPAGGGGARGDPGQAAGIEGVIRPKKNSRAALEERPGSVDG